MEQKATKLEFRDLQSYSWSRGPVGVWLPKSIPPPDTELGLILTNYPGTYKKNLMPAIRIPEGIRQAGVVQHWRFEAVGGGSPFCNC